MKIKTSKSAYVHGQGKRPMSSMRTELIALCGPFLKEKY